MLPAFVLYWAAVADFNFAVGTGAFKELYGMDILLGTAISFGFKPKKKHPRFTARVLIFVRL